MRPPRRVYVVVPDGIDDPTRPSGGNTYDRRVCDGLAALGWSVHERAVPGAWPSADASARNALAEALQAIPEGAVAIVDGLVASAAPEVVVPQAARIRLVVLVHMPFGEGADLLAADAVVTTSTWTRTLLLDSYPLRPTRVHVAAPGVDAADLAPVNESGRELLCVAAVTPGKGHDVLLAGLADIADLPWRCVCVGSLDRDPAYVQRLLSQARESGIEDRVSFAGPRTGAALEATYAGADVLVLASRGETYGMVVAEALARGLPSVATTVGGLPETLGRASDGSRPGLLVPPEDPAALASALRSWLVDADTRTRLRAAAHSRRETLRGWPITSFRISRVLDRVAA